ncbi:hypothetical protein GF325_06255 [Candidatus Bathyarchaeota archaeon]|nr:hypothetical protein [Candidatus Bathyarchaeota archaeon]
MMMMMRIAKEKQCLLASVVVACTLASIAIGFSSMERRGYHPGNKIGESTLSFDYKVVGPGNDPGTSVWCQDEYVYITRLVMNLTGHDDFEIRKYWKNNGTFIEAFKYATPADETVEDIWSNGMNLYTVGTQGTSMLVVKWDLAGNIIWDSTFDSSIYLGRAIFGDGDYLYACGFRQQGSNVARFYKIHESNGSVIWTKTVTSSYRGVKNTWCNDTSAYLLLHNSGNLYLSKWDLDGTMDWERSFPATSYLDICGLWSNGEHVYTSYAYGDDLRIRKYDTGGNLAWERIWDSGNYDFGSSLWIDSTYVYVGGYTSTSSFGNDPTPVLVKYSKEGVFNDVISGRVQAGYWSRIHAIHGSGDTIYASGASDINGFSENMFLQAYHTIVPPEPPVLDPVGEDVDGNYTVNWNDVAKADSYSLYREEIPITNVSSLSPIYTGAVSQHDETGISPGVYYYAVVASNVTLGDSLQSNCIEVNVTGTLDVPIIESIISPNTNGTYWVNWSTPAGASSYELYRSDAIITATEDMTPIYMGAEPGHQETGMDLGVYHYVVVARGAGAQSPLSEEVTVSVEDVPSVTTMNTLSSPSHDGSFWVSWNSSPGATGYDLYKNTSSFSSTSGLSPIYSGPSLSYFQSGLDVGEYFFAVVARNSSGESGLSDCVSINCTVPDAPASMTFGNVDIAGNFEVSWDGVTGAISYKLFRDTTFITNVSILIPVFNGGPTSHVESGLPAGTYFYRVVATGPLGDSVPSPCENITLSPPGNLTINPLPTTNIGGNYTVNWTSANLGVTYQLYRSESQISDVSGLTPLYNGSDTHFTFIGDSIGTHYYAVVAWNPFGNSNLSNCESINVYHLPDAPILHQPPSPDVDGNYTISWEPVPLASSYCLYRAPVTITNVSSLAPIYNGTNTFLEDVISTWTTNYYVVVASNGTGNSSLSNCIKVISGPIENVTTRDDSLWGKSQVAPDNISNIYAVIVGVSDYSGFLWDLSYCDDDAWDMESFLTNYYCVPSDNIMTLVNTQATNASISDAITTTAGLMGENDTFFFFFSGHGGGQLGGGGLRTENDGFNHIPLTISQPGASRMKVNINGISFGETVYVEDGRHGGICDILTSNGESEWVYTDQLKVYTDIGDSATLFQYEWDDYMPPYEIYPTDHENVIQTSHLDALLDHVPGKTICMIDACHSGGFVTHASGANRIVLSACQSSELSIEGSAYQNGLFTWEFQRVWNMDHDTNGDLALSLEEIFSDLYDRTVAESTSIGYPYHPQMSDGIAGETNLKPTSGIINYTFTKNGNASLNITQAGAGFANRLCAYYDIAGEQYMIVSNDTGILPSDGTALLEYTAPGGGFTTDGVAITLESRYGKDLSITHSYQLTLLAFSNITDSDGDGLTDQQEFFMALNPWNQDTDGDGMHDGFEMTHGLSVFCDDAGLDLDGDGLSNGEESANGTDPNDIDTDGDGLNDYNELETHGTDPTNADSDGDGHDDGAEIIEGTDPMDDQDYPGKPDSTNKIPGFWLLPLFTLAGIATVVIFSRKRCVHG